MRSAICGLWPRAAPPVLRRAPQTNRSLPGSSDGILFRAAALLAAPFARLADLLPWGPRRAARELDPAKASGTMKVDGNPIRARLRAGMLSEQEASRLPLVRVGGARRSDLPALRRSRRLLVLRPSTYHTGDADFATAVYDGIELFGHRIGGLEQRGRGRTAGQDRQTCSLLSIHDSI